jgi:hypothetical protein
MSDSVTLGLVHGGWRPAYAKELLAMREQGEAPVDPILVTDCWPLARKLRAWIDWPVLVCDPPERRFDLALVHGLEVIAVHTDAAPTATWIAQIRAHAPRSLEVHEALSFARALEAHMTGLLARRTL